MFKNKKIETVGHLPVIMIFSLCISYFIVLSHFTSTPIKVISMMWNYVWNPVYIWVAIGKVSIIIFIPLIIIFHLSDIIRFIKNKRVIQKIKPEETHYPLM